MVKKDDEDHYPDFSSQERIDNYFDFSEPNWAMVSDQAKDFIKICLKHKPNQRTLASEL